MDKLVTGVRATLDEERSKGVDPQIFGKVSVNTKVHLRMSTNPSIDILPLALHFLCRNCWTTSCRACRLNLLATTPIQKLL